MQPNLVRRAPRLVLPCRWIGETIPTTQTAAHSLLYPIEACTSPSAPCTELEPHHEDEGAVPGSRSGKGCHIYLRVKVLQARSCTVSWLLLLCETPWYARIRASHTFRADDTAQQLLPRYGNPHSRTDFRHSWCLRLRECHIRGFAAASHERPIVTNCHAMPGCGAAPTRRRAHLACR